MTEHSGACADRPPKHPKTEYGMRYCREHGWVEAVRGYHPEYGPKPVCPDCGPFGPGLFRNPSKLVDYDHETALLEREAHPLQTDTDGEQAHD